MSFQTIIHTLDVKGLLKSSVAPSTSEHLTTKEYVDNAIAAGGGDWLASVKEQLSAQPSTPSSGDRYLIGTSATGSAWSGKDNNVAEYDGSAWSFTSPSEGMHVFIEGGSGALGADVVAVYNGSAWVKGASLNGALVATNNLSDVSSAGSARANLGLGNLATENDVSLSTEVTGTLGISNGGTGATSATAGFDALSPMTAAGDLIVGGSSGSATRLATGSSGQVLKVGSSGLEWGSSGGSGTVSSVALKGDDDSSTTAVTSSGTIDVDGGAAVTGGSNPIQTSVASGALVISPRLGSTSVVGVASFNSDNFDVNSSGDVTIKAAGVDLTAEVAGALPVANGGTGATSVSAAQVALDLEPGVDIQAYNAKLADVAGLDVSDGNFIVGDGSNFVAESGATARTTLATGRVGGTIPSLASGLSGGDIAVKVSSSGTIEGVSSFTLSNISDAGDVASKNIVGSLSLTSGRVFVADSGTSFSAGDFLKLDSSGNITSGSAGSGTVTSITPDADSGTGSAITSSGSIKVSGTSPISTSVSGTDITIAASDASTSAKGVAKFDSDFFSVSSGEVSLSLAGALKLKATPYSGSAQTLTPTFAAGPEVMMIDVSGVGSGSSVTLPQPGTADIGKSFEVKVMGGMSSTNKVSITVSNSGKMDGETTIELDQDYQRLKFTAFGTSTGGVNYAIG